MFSLEDLQRALSGVIKDANVNGFSTDHVVQAVDLSCELVQDLGGLRGSSKRYPDYTIGALEGTGSVRPYQAGVVRLTVDLAINPNDGRLLGDMVGTPEAAGFYDQVMNAINPLIATKRRS